MNLRDSSFYNHKFTQSFPNRKGGGSFRICVNAYIAERLIFDVGGVRETLYKRLALRAEK